MGIAMDPAFYSGRPFIYLAYTVDPNRNGGMNYNMVRPSKAGRRMFIVD
jgi:hypothetical protein